MKSKPKIGLALGSGSSRGWSHIGIIGALADLGIEPDIICGTSIGSIVGASFVAGNLPKLEDWVRSLTKLDTARFFEISSAMNGFVNTKRLHAFLNKCVARDDAAIESFDKSYAAVSTDLQTGREVWFTTGPIIEAVWASISLPGLFPAIRNDSKWLVDGGLVNPVPVSVCRALGADIVIAVNLNGNIAGKHFEHPKKQPNHINRVTDLVTDLVREYTGDLFSSPESEGPATKPVRCHCRLREHCPGQDHAQPHGWRPAGYPADTETCTYRPAGILSRQRGDRGRTELRAADAAGNPARTGHGLTHMKKGGRHGAPPAVSPGDSRLLQGNRLLAIRHHHGQPEDFPHLHTAAVIGNLPGRETMIDQPLDGAR